MCFGLWALSLICYLDFEIWISLMSYRKNHIKHRIKKIKPKKSIFKRPIFWIIFFISILAVSVFYFLFFYPGFYAKHILISGNNKIDSGEIKNIISGGIGKKIISIGQWNLISNSIFFIDLENIEKKVITGFPEIEIFKIKKKYPQTLIAEITERQPFAVFCQQNASQKPPDDCFFIDKTGVIFEYLQILPADNFVVRQTLNQKESYAGERAIPKDIMESILKIEKNLKDSFNIKITEALISSPLRLNIKTSENWEIYFDLNSDINLQIAKINSLLSEEVSESARKNLQYVDLRFKDKAYYK